MAYVIFLLPLWFGWEVVRRNEAIGASRQMLLAFTSLPLGFAVTILTAYAWLWVYPSAAGVQNSSFVLIGHNAALVMLAGGVSRVIMRSLFVRHVIEVVLKGIVPRLRHWR